MTEQHSNQDRVGTGKVIRTALIACGAAFAFAFSLVPLYRVFCEITGINYTGFALDASRAAERSDAGERWVTVQFDGSVQSDLAWAFRPGTRQMRVRVGELYDTHYVAENVSSRPLVGQANPSVAPSTAALYFHKTECFCFTEQLLAAGESRDMPVRFLVDPDLPAHVQVLTLSYTFHLNSRASAQLAESEPVAVHTGL